MTITEFKKYLLIDNQYKLYNDGVIYNTVNDKDIPQWIFQLRDFVLKNSDKMDLIN